MISSNKSVLLKFARFLPDSFLVKHQILTAISGVDYPQQDNRFSLDYKYMLFLMFSQVCTVILFVKNVAFTADNLALIVISMPIIFVVFFQIFLILHFYSWSGQEILKKILQNLFSLTSIFVIVYNFGYITMAFRVLPFFLSMLNLRPWLKKGKKKVISWRDFILKRVVPIIGISEDPYSNSKAVIAAAKSVSQATFDNKFLEECVSLDSTGKLATAFKTRMAYRAIRDKAQGISDEAFEVKERSQTAYDAALNHYQSVKEETEALSRVSALADEDNWVPLYTNSRVSGAYKSMEACKLSARADEDNWFALYKETQAADALSRKENAILMKIYWEARKSKAESSIEAIDVVDPIDALKKQLQFDALETDKQILLLTKNEKNLDILTTKVNKILREADSKIGESLSIYPNYPYPIQSPSQRHEALIDALRRASEEEAQVLASASEEEALPFLPYSLVLPSDGRAQPSFAETFQYASEDKARVEVIRKFTEEVCNTFTEEESKALVNDICNTLLKEEWL